MAEWYDGGLRFECTMCGACCTGAPGYILYTRADAAAIAARLGITPEAFERDYTQDLGMTIAGRTRSFREVRTEHGHDCVFLDRASTPGKAVCSIHDLRPTQCRTFPFWPEHLVSPREWQRASRACEGIGRGGIVPLTQVRVLAERHARDRAERA
jgi:hypothetical protein